MKSVYLNNYLRLDILRKTREKDGISPVFEVDQCRKYPGC